MRLDAYESLKTIGPEDKEAVPALIKALKDEDPKVRWVAADTLGRIGPNAKAAESALGQAMNDKDITVMKAAIRAYRLVIKGPDPKSLLEK